MVLPMACHHCNNHRKCSHMAPGKHRWPADHKLCDILLHGKPIKGNLNSIT